MKAELPVSLVIIVAVLLLVLIVVGFFFFGQAGQAGASADTTKFFFDKCTEYRANNCQWSLTKQEGFDKFLSACQKLYGSDKQEYSCLYNLCQDCKSIEREQVSCSGECSLCNGNKLAGLNSAECCSAYQAKCGSTYECGACV